MPLKIGDKAPDFTLYDVERKERSLIEFSGKPVVLVFYPGAFTGVCTKEICAFRDSLASFNNIGAQVVGISVDSPFANKGFTDANKINFPLLSDFSREIIKKYDVVFTGLAGLKDYVSSTRAVFVLDGNGIIRYTWIMDNPGQEPPYDEVIAAARWLNSGIRCRRDWTGISQPET